MDSVIHSVWPWNLLANIMPDVFSSCRHPYHCLFFIFNNMPSLTSYTLPSSLLGRCLLSVSLPSSSLAVLRWEHLEIQFSPPHWQIGMGRMSPPLRSLKPDSVLGEHWKPALALGHLYWNDCDRPWASLAPHRLGRIMQPYPAQTGLVNEVDITGRQLPERRLVVAWWIPDSAPISPSWVKSKLINAPEDWCWKLINTPEDWCWKDHSSKATTWQIDWAFWRCKTATFKCAMSESDWSERTLRSLSLLLITHSSKDEVIVLLQEPNSSRSSSLYLNIRLK